MSEIEEKLNTGIEDCQKDVDKCIRDAKRWRAARFWVLLILACAGSCCIEEEFIDNHRLIGWFSVVYWLAVLWFNHWATTNGINHSRKYKLIFAQHRLDFQKLLDEYKGYKSE
jgi:hypothetical protein